MDLPRTFERERAVVIGCGGVLGIAWSVGLIAGLARKGLKLHESDLWVGASAGSVVAARLAAQVPVDELMHEQTNGLAVSQEQLRPYSQADVDEKNRQLFDKVRGDLLQARQRIGAWALRSNTPPLEQRKLIIAQRLNGLVWPQKSLRIVTVNALTGEEKIWDSSSGISLTDAVAASCAVPGIWPCVPLQGEHYMDGGLRSMTNADLAAQSRRVLVISPQGYSDGNPVSGQLRAEIDALLMQGSIAHVIEPDSRCLATIGPNILDPSRCAAVALAGERQGLELADAAHAFWLGQASPNPFNTTPAYP